MILIGVFVLIIDPPRTVSSWSTVRIPYTVFEEVSPGYHNYTTTLFSRSAAIRLSNPGENTTRIKIDKFSDRDCNYTKLVLHVFGEGFLGLVNDKYVNVSIYYVRGNNETLLDSISVPIKASGLTTPTPVTITMKPGETIYTTTPFPIESVSYEVRSINNYLTGRVAKIDVDQLKVTIQSPSEGIILPQNISEIIIKAKTDTDGEIIVTAHIGAFCIKTYYLDKPIYKPKTYYYTYSIPVTRINLGGLTIALALSIIGLVLILLSLIPIIHGYIKESKLQTKLTIENNSIKDKYIHE